MEETSSKSMVYTLVLNSSLELVGIYSVKLFLRVGAPRRHNVGINVRSAFLGRSLVDGSVICCAFRF